MDKLSPIQLYISGLDLAPSGPSPLIPADTCEPHIAAPLKSPTPPLLGPAQPQLSYAEPGFLLLPWWSGREGQVLSYKASASVEASSPVFK